MPSLSEHLRSPQYPDEELMTEEDLRKPGFSLIKISGGWVAPGQPRWKAYVLYVASIIGGAFLAIPGPGDFAFFTLFGIIFVGFGIFGIAETIRGKRFPRLR